MTTADLRDKQIESYIHNRMDADERAQFEHQMNDDPALKKEVDELLSIKNLFDKNLYDLKKKLDETERQLEQEKFFDEKIIPVKKHIHEVNGKVRKFSPFGGRGAWMAIAASVILIAGFLYVNLNKEDMQQLAYNAAQNDYSNVRGVTDEVDSLFQAEAYQQLIEKASEQIKLTTAPEEKEKLSIYITRSYILSKKPGEAINFIENLPDELKQNCDLKYSLALAYLSKKDKTSAATILNEIVDTKCFPQEMHAKELLKKL